MPCYHYNYFFSLFVNNFRPFIEIIIKIFLALMMKPSSSTGVSTIVPRSQPRLKRSCNLSFFLYAVQLPTEIETVELQSVVLPSEIVVK